MHYYVINLPRCEDRKGRIVKRLEHHDISNYTIIDAIDRNSPLIDWFEAGMKRPAESTRGEHACFLSHLKALRAFVDNPDTEEAIILEDDAMLHNDFEDRLDYVLSSKNKVGLIMLCSFISSMRGVKAVPMEDLNLIEASSEKPVTFYKIKDEIYGTQCYWLTKDYARSCLARMDKPLRYLGVNRITSECITLSSKGYFVLPLLVIEEASYSTLRQNEGSGIDRHREYFAQFGFDNYSSAEEGNIRDIWQPYGYEPALKDVKT